MAVTEYNPDEAEINWILLSTVAYLVIDSTFDNMWLLFQLIGLLNTSSGAVYPANSTVNFNADATIE